VFWKIYQDLSKKFESPPHHLSMSHQEVKMRSFPVTISKKNFRRKNVEPKAKTFSFFLDSEKRREKKCKSPIRNNSNLGFVTAEQITLAIKWEFISWE
jgi:hypothetical protein